MFYFQLLRKRKGLFLLLFVILFLQTGCSLGYYGHLIDNQLRIISKSKPIEEALKEESLSKENKRKLSLILEAKGFGEEYLGLKRTENYTTFVNINKRFVGYAVSASSKYKLEPYTWNFPFVGTLLYKGYFDLEEAIKEKERLEKMGLDTYLRPVSAYSTLGWFKDPVLSSLLRHDDSEIVNIVIHELAHSTIYRKEYPKFNEGLATFIGNQGSLDFFRSKFGLNSKEYQRAWDMIHDDLLFSKFLKELYKDLESFYSLDISKEEKLMGRERIFRDSKIKLRSLGKEFRTGVYLRFYDRALLNNAFILALSQYMIDLDNFYTVFEIHRKDLKKTIDFFKGEAFNKGDPLKYMLQWIEENKKA